MMTRLLGLIALLCALAVSAAPEKGRVPVGTRTHWTTELFGWSNDDPLRDYRIGDTVLMTVSVREGAVMHYGHRGRICYPTLDPPASAGVC